MPSFPSPRRRRCRSYRCAPLSNVYQPLAALAQLRQSAVSTTMCRLTGIVSGNASIEFVSAPGTASFLEPTVVQSSSAAGAEFSALDKQTFPLSFFFFPSLNG
ncbi:hypothetical protein GGI42DRAFT_112726 [Trichoderma sp. SZMC 28013]